MRCSNLDQAKECPGSVRMQEGLPDEEDSEERREGNDGHFFMAHPEYDRSVLKPQMQDLLRTADQLEEEIFSIVIEKEKIRDLEEFVQSRELPAAWSLDGTRLLTGHIDLARGYPRRSLHVIIDWKFGWIPVERAELNMQLRGYAVLSGDDAAYVAIGQPRAPYGQRLTIAKYTLRDIEQSRLEIYDIIKATEDPEAPLHPGLHCRYCRARAICPALKEAVTNSLVPMGILSPELSKAKKLGIVEARLAGLSDDQLGAMLDAYQLVQFVYDPMMEEARRRIAADKLSGWKMTRPIERRKIVDSRKAIALLMLAGMTRQEVMDCVSLSITKVQDKTSKEYVTQHLSGVIELETSRPRVIKK